MNADKIFKSLHCEVRTDDINRNLYATDASIYQIVPRAVALPKSAEEASEVIQAAAAAGMPITLRGAGTGLAGGAVGDGLVIDTARYTRTISEFNPEAKTVRVGAGVVLDQLNDFLKPHGLTFGPDVATSSRATFGGMIGNNSSGARAPIYGTTIDHIRSVDVVLADGQIVTLAPGGAALSPQTEALDALIQPHAEEIATRFHEGVCKRWPGYGLDRYLRRPRDLSRLIGGSEGTLAMVLSAEVEVVALPKKRGLMILFFDDIDDAMTATVEILKLAPAGVEHIDDVLLDQTKGQLLFKPVRELLELDARPSTSMLLVEFYEGEHDKIETLKNLGLSPRHYVCKDVDEINRVQNMRKAGLSLLTGRKGAAKPVAGIEDAAVTPARLPEYVKELRAIMDGIGLHASFYGHAASGLLHVRPIVDMHDGQDIARFRRVAEGAAQLCSEMQGSFTAEHGVGIARTEFMEAQVGANLLGVMREIKAVFDPKNLLNPGKIIDDGRYKIDGDLRMGAGYEIPIPFEEMLGYVKKDESFVGNLEQCNGCGGCRKDSPTMCPTFIATGEDIMATRGRANIIRAVLEGRIQAADPLLSADLDKAISNCLSCKACATECPSNVNLALLKAELLYARHRIKGVPLGARVISRVDFMNRLASLAPGLTNASLRWKWLRLLMKHLLGVSPKRPLPTYASERFDTWFYKHRPHKIAGQRGEVILWDDCFVRHNEPNIGQAAVVVLERAGYEVRLIKGHACCGRPAFSTGRLDVAENFGKKNLALLANTSAPVIFLEPSCYSMFSEDYAELRLDGAQQIPKRVFLFEDFMITLFNEAPDALAFSSAPRKTAIHAHCHAKALTDTAAMPKLAGWIPNNEVQLMDTGCCGMAGQFGALEDKYELSLKVAEPLVEKINALAPGTQLIASGTSCRHQITHLTKAAPLHMAELLAEALEEAE